MGLHVRAATLQARSSFDARGTLGLSRDIAVGVAEIDIDVALDSDASQQQLDRLGELTERYCVVGQSLRSPVRIRIEPVPPTNAALPAL